MRKKILTFIPAAILLLISVVLIIIAIVTFSQRDKGVKLIKATNITEIAGTVELEVEGMKLFCQSVCKDKKNNFVLKAGGSIRIKPTKFSIIAFKNADLLSTRFENGEEMILIEGKKSGSYYKFNIINDKDKGYTFVLENQSTDDINIGYIKYWE